MKIRHASKEYAAKVYTETKSVAKTAKRIGYTWVGTARLLHRAGVLNSRTGRSR